jgi:hypothetical protein
MRISARTTNSHAGEKCASLLINGVQAHTWPLRDAWSTVECVADSHLLRDDTNVVTIVWPDPDEQREDRVRLVSEALPRLQMLEERPPPDVFTVYGEISLFTARPVGRTERPRSAGPSDRSAS